MAQRRSVRACLNLLAGGALLATLVATPAATAARTPPPVEPTAATRTVTVRPELLGVPRGAATGRSLGIPAAAGGGAGALRSLRRPGATLPHRFDLPRWLPQLRTMSATSNGASASSAANLRRSAVSTAGHPSAGPAVLLLATAPASSTVGLRSEQGTFGLSDADDSLLYADCSVFRLCEEPPDPSVAVSANDVVQGVNEVIMMLERSTQGARFIPAFDFFALDNNQVAQAAPRILHDAAHQRWLATEVSSDCSHSYLQVAISSSDDPFAPWTNYRVVFPGRVVDFPGVGTSDRTIVVGLNAYARDPSATDCLAPGDFEGGMFVTIDWADLIATVPTLPVTVSAPDPTLFTPRPATSAGGGAQVRLVVAIDNGSADSSDVGYATVTGSNATRDVTVSPVVNLTKSQGLTPFRTPPAPRQPGDVPTIAAAVDGQPTDAIAAGSRLWFVGTAPCTPAGDDAVRDCVRITELVTGAAPTAVGVASDTILQERGADLFMGGIGRSIDGSLFAVYSRSSATEIISTWATVRRPADRAFLAPSLIIPGGGPYSGRRWGDYVILSPDPTAVDAIWQGNEVPSVDGSWFTWLSQLRPAPSGPLAGSVRLNGGDAFAAESFVGLELTNPTGVAATIVRVANGPATRNGLLVGGQTMPIADQLPWSLDIDQPGDRAADGLRHVYVQWGDGQGHWSAVATDDIILDTTPPTIGPFVTPRIGTSTLGATGSVPIELRWGSGRDVSSGLEGYDVEISEDDGEWQDFAFTGAPRATGRIAPGHVYLWRVRSFDRLGNASNFVESEPIRVAVVDDASTSLHYGIGWRVSTAASSYKGTLHRAAQNGASATMTFTGRAVGIVAPINRGDPAGAGSLTVFVDGKRVGAFTQGGSVTRVGRIGLVVTVKPGRHTLRIVATVPKGQQVHLDAVIVLR